MKKNLTLGVGMYLLVLTLISPALGQISQLPLIASAGSSTLIYNSPFIDSASIAYRASFTVKDWVGRLKAYRIDADGVTSTLLWDAEPQMPDSKTRNIMTWNREANSAVDFQWSQLSQLQKIAIGSADVLNFLRGDTALEAAQNIGDFRNRKSRLGDIVNSLPIFVKNTNFGYAALPELVGGGVVYQNFESRKNDRTAMIYVGSNDGLLHGFDAVTGAEKFTYIPQSLFPYLSLLSDPSYQHKHRYFVDGQLTQGDAFLRDKLAATSVWKTIVLGTTGAGAKSIFAIDVSTPDLLNAKSVMWERSEVLSDGTIDNDMGFVLGEAAVVRLRNGQWAALYGNGYDSNNKKATLYLVNIADGSLIKKIQTEDRGNSAQNSLQNSAQNGLSTPALLFNSRREVIAAYAGDLRGNVWKFDLESTDVNAWDIAFQGRPLYVATDRSGAPQPIVQQPVMARHPYGGRMIMFGTGKLFEVTDPLNKQVQTITAIWENADEVSTIEGRYQLQHQTLSSVIGGRIISKNSIDWRNQRGWYVDLPNLGERVVGKLQIINGLLVILTYTPGMHAGVEDAPSSEIMLIDFTTGTAASKPIFSSFPNGQISIRVAPSTASPNVLTHPDGKRSLVIQGVDGGQKIVPLALTRKQPFRTWHQLPVPN